MSLLQALNLPAASPKPGPLLAAAEAWRQTHGQAGARIAALKAAVKAQCAGAPAPLVKSIDKGLLKLDGVLDSVDGRLADALTTAGNAGDGQTRRVELEKAKAIVAEYIGYVKSEPLVAHMDRNPFGVKTELQALLAAGLAKAAKAIG